MTPPLVQPVRAVNATRPVGDFRDGSIIRTAVGVLFVIKSPLFCLTKAWKHKKGDIKEVTGPKKKKKKKQ